MLVHRSMGSGSAWLGVAGLVVLSAVACTSQLTDEERPEGAAGSRAAGNPNFAGGGAGGKPTTAQGGALGGSAGRPSIGRGGSANLPESAGAAGDAGGLVEPSAGAGGVSNELPDPCQEYGACAGSPGDFAGAGGAEDVTPGECGGGHGCVVAQGSAIPALDADTTDLYWVDHGTFDDLGNYNNDGRLWKRALAAGSSEVPLASGLAGPVGLGLTTTHVFVYLDQVWQGKPRYALSRVPIAGGAAQVVQLDAWPNGERQGDCARCLVHSGDTLYFPLEGGIYKIAAQDAQPSLFSTLRASSLAIAGEYLYLTTRISGGVWRIPLVGGAAEQLSADPRLNIQVAGGYVYSLDNGANRAYLTRMPATGGPWLRLPKARSSSAFQLQIAGDWFFHELFSDAGHQFVAGLLADTASAAVPLTLADSTSVRAWVGTPQGIFWTGGQVIRRRSNTE